MRSRAELLEKIAGRKAVSCLGVFLFFILLVFILALLWPKHTAQPNAPEPKRPGLPAF